MNDSTIKTKILVWDAPVRIFHWLLVLCVVVTASKLFCGS
mgnify:CR=1 FL=1